MTIDSAVLEEAKAHVRNADHQHKTYGRRETQEDRFASALLEADRIIQSEVIWKQLVQERAENAERQLAECRATLSKVLNNGGGYQ